MHATHTAHAVPDLRIAAGRLLDGLCHLNGIGQSEKQANQAAKDLVKRFLKDAKNMDKKNG